MVLQATVSKFVLFVLPLLITELQGLKNDDDVLGIRTGNNRKDDISLILPSAVEKGDDLSMDCQYNSSSYPRIYSVKWYKGKREFFRVEPKGRQEEKKVFKLEGVIVDENRSNISRVYIRNVPLGLTGSITCEITPETNFREVKKTQNLTVIVQAENPPVLEAIPGQVGQTKYQIGDTVRLSCFSGPSKPASNLTFFINNVPYTDRSFIQYPPEVGTDVQSDNKNNGMESRRAVINVTLNETLFIRYKIKIKCAAVIYNFEKFSSQVELDQLIPSRPAASGYGNRHLGTSSASHSFPGKLNWSITTIRVGMLVLLSLFYPLSISSN